MTDERLAPAAPMQADTEPSSDMGQNPISTTKLSDDERFNWLRLIRCGNVGPATFHDLLQHFGSAKKALNALPELSRRGGSKRKIQIASEQDSMEEWQQIHQGGARLVALGEDDYPEALLHIHAPPPLLTVVGSGEWARKDSLAIVGSRNCSAAGKKLTTSLAQDLGAAGIVIASGLARGIDTAAHNAALPTGTIAVVAGGLNRIYPQENLQLAHQIAREGLLISEMPWNWQARHRDFPRRNRIISGLSLGTLIIEAAKKSGSLITARYALEQNREVFAIPGSPLDPRAEGGNHLIQQGAYLVCNADDILKNFANRLPMQRIADPLTLLEQQNESVEEEAEDTQTDLSDKDREAFIQTLSPTPISMDELVRQSHLTTAQAQMVLLELDLAGRLERHGNQMVSLLH